jgi:hypothetical protein
MRGAAGGSLGSLRGNTQYARFGNSSALVTFLPPLVVFICFQKGTVYQGGADFQGRPGLV